jgi:hypothetical protein
MNGPSAHAVTRDPDIQAGGTGHSSRALEIRADV